MVDRGGGSTAFEEYVSFGDFSLGGIDCRETEFLEASATIGVDVGDGHHARSASSSDKGADRTDGSAAGDEYAGPEGHIGLLASPHANGQGLHECGCVETDVAGDRVNKVTRQHNVFAKGSIYGRGGEELHVRAEVVATGTTLPAAPARDTGLHRDGGADLQIGDVHTHSRDHTGRLVPENEWLLDDEVCDAAVLEVVNVAATDTD